MMFIINIPNNVNFFNIATNIINIIHNMYIVIDIITANIYFIEYNT